MFVYVLNSKADKLGSEKDWIRKRRDDVRKRSKHSDLSVDHVARLAANSAGDQRLLDVEEKMEKLVPCPTIKAKSKRHAFRFAAKERNIYVWDVLLDEVRPLIRDKLKATYVSNYALADAHLVQSLAKLPRRLEWLAKLQGHLIIDKTGGWIQYAAAVKTNVRRDLFVTPSFVERHSALANVVKLSMARSRSWQVVAA
eukprot:s5328_g4.t1